MRYEINEATSLRCKNVTVRGNVKTQGDLDANELTANCIHAMGNGVLTKIVCNSTVTIMGNCTLTGSTIRGKVTVYGKLTATNSTLEGLVMVYGQLLATSSSFRGSITVTGNAEFNQCNELPERIAGSAEVSLRGVHIRRDLTCSAQALRVIDSRIEDRLSSSTTDVSLTNSTVKTLVLEEEEGSSSSSTDQPQFNFMGPVHLVVDSGNGFPNANMHFARPPQHVVTGRSAQFSSISFTDGGVVMTSSVCAASTAKPPVQLIDTTVRRIIFSQGDGRVLVSGNAAPPESVQGGVIEKK
ncbi:MAG: hypothetical protein A3F09_00760 [Chlamydiae bacterium RIFCSPHIGHO2_12_FULL_49_11]|nr:MAG: hypothetical protein A3F09_00760 [Chlamydiae bacterium RIFCSPHIGHO2_12_FULL_49_11]